MGCRTVVQLTIGEKKYSDRMIKHFANRYGWVERTLPLRMMASISLAGWCLSGGTTTAIASVFLYHPPQTIVQPLLAFAEPPQAEAVSFQLAREQFVEQTAARFGLDPAAIRTALNSAVFQPSIVMAMQHPAEKVKTWAEYRGLFLTPTRIRGGQEFLRANAALLTKIEHQSGVPAEIITAIIGVETLYGANTGHYRVLDALYTLAFGYPVRSEPEFKDVDTQRAMYFRDELAQFFALCREEHLPLTELKGSYAGAIGMGQFMPSSYRALAKDGNRDGRRNLLTNTADIVASISNYLTTKGGWKSGGPIAVPATLEPGHPPIESENLTAMYKLSELSARGYHVLAPVTKGVLATPVTLHNPDTDEYWLGFQNFYAITSYNHSPQYAMAVFQLAQAIKVQAEKSP